MRVVVVLVALSLMSCGRIAQRTVSQKQDPKKEPAKTAEVPKAVEPVNVVVKWATKSSELLSHKDFQSPKFQNYSLYGDQIRILRLNVEGSLWDPTAGRVEPGIFGVVGMGRTSPKPDVACEAYWVITPMKKLNSDEDFKSVELRMDLQVKPDQSYENCIQLAEAFLSGPFSLRYSQLIVEETLAPASLEIQVEPRH